MIEGYPYFNGLECLSKPKVISLLAGSLVGARAASKPAKPFLAPFSLRE